MHSVPGSLGSGGAEVRLAPADDSFGELDIACAVG